MKLNGENLSISDVYAIAFHREPVELDTNKLDKVQTAHERIQEWGEAEYPIYGVNTGFGDLVHIIVPSQYKSELQYNLVRSHAAGGGPLFPDEVVRAIMAVRLNCLIKGYSGANPKTLELLRQLLNRGIHPVIPQQGSLGASGDLSPLAHMTLPLIGDGYVRVNGETRRSSEVLEEHNLQPIKPGYKEALALINGTSAMTGTACIALVRAYKLLQWEIIASADLLQCLGGSTRAFEARGHALKNHSGQIRIAQALRQAIAQSTLTRDHAEIMQSIKQHKASADDVVDVPVFLQHAYTLRCIPQILGPVLDTLEFSRKLVEEEVNSCNDNPLVFETPEETFHGGHFHGQYVAMASDYLNIALTEIGVLAERQLNRLLDPYLNGELPAFLAHGRAGLVCGFEGGQYLATSIASENLDIAAPSSIKSIPSNGQNQDVVSMGLISARKSLQLCENVGTILSVLVAACYQASHFIGQEKFNPTISQLHEKLSALGGQYLDDFPLNELLSRVRELVTSEQLWSYLDTQVDFEGTGSK
ncbi:MAG TPA: tyrosine 2,3-aminomutase [Pyrinomonadaceae bacterium]|jgi:histidine ammonia-lyase/tyrosine ammonia-lyase